MTSTRKVKLQDRGTPEPKPSRKVVLDELLRSLQDLVTHELAAEVPLDENPAPIPEPDAPKAATTTRAAATPPGRTATETAFDTRATRPAIEPRASAAVRAPEHDAQDLIVEELVAEPVASPAKIATTSAPDSRPAVAAAAKTSPPAAVVKPETAKPANKSKPPELAIESGPILSAPERKTAAPAAVEPEAAKPARKSKPLELAIEPEAAAPPPERKSPARAPDPAAMARPRRNKLGDTVVLTPPRDIPPPPKAASKRDGRQAVVETPVPPQGLQQQLPYLDVSPSPAGSTADTGLLVEPEIEIPQLPEARKPAREAPTSKNKARADHDLLAEPEIELPDLPLTGLMPASPPAGSPLDRADAMATDGPDELPDLDHSAVPAAAFAAPKSLSVVVDDTGPSDIPLLEDAIDLDEHIELSSPKPPVPAKPAVAGTTGGDPRRLAIQLAARLNVDLRREGKPVLGSDVIAKLARLLEESLAKGAPNMENTRPKKP